MSRLNDAAIWFRIESNAALNNVTNAGLRELANLKTLKHLLLYNTGVTARGVAELKRELSCEIGY